MANATDRLDALIRLNASQITLLQKISDGVTALIGQGKGGKGGATVRQKVPGASSGGKGSPFVAIAQAAGSVSKVFGAVGAVVGAVVGAFLAVPTAIAGIVSVASGFVKALNPTLVEHYENQLANLSATIGYALTPVISYAADAIKQWAGILLPTVQRLRPIVEQLSHAISGVTIGAVRLFGGLVDLVTEYASVVVGEYGRYLEAFGALFEVLGAVVKSFQPLSIVLDAFTEAQRSCADGARKFVVMLAVATAKLMAFFGATETLKKFKQGLADAIKSRKNPTGGLMAAPKDASVSGFEEILRRMQERAYIATAGGDTRAPEVALLEEISTAIGPIAVSSKTWKEDLKQAFVEGVRELLPANKAREKANALLEKSDVSTSSWAWLSPFANTKL